MPRPESSQVVDNRGRILALLCSANRTISELALALGISANGVRGHLGQLEAEGLVAYRVVRRGVGKPAHEYRLTPEGSSRLSRAYLPVLSELLSTVERRASAEEGEVLLRAVGRALARRNPEPAGSLAQRVDSAVELLRAMGAVCLVREEKGTFWIQGACCPLGALVPAHPAACKAVEAMLEEYIGVPVREQCEKDDPPSCRLLVGGSEGSAGPLLEPR